MTSRIMTVGEDDFDRVVLQSQTLVLVDFWAEWCGPCKRISAVLEELARMYEHHLVVVKVNVDQNRRLAGRYHVCSVPLLMLFNRGKIRETRAGVVCMGQLRHMVQRALAAAAA